MSGFLSFLTLLVQEHGGAEGGEEVHHNPILPEADELIFGTLAFLVVFVMLAKFAFPAMNKMLKQRTERIQGEMERAEKTRSEADQILADYQTQLSGAREESNRIIEEARRTAESLRRDLVSRAETDAQAIVARAQEEVRAERDRVFAELKRSVGELSVELAARVVGQELDKARHARLVDDYIDEVARLSPGAGGQGGSAPPRAEGPSA